MNVWLVLALCVVAFIAGIAVGVKLWAALEETPEERAWLEQ